MNEQHRPDRTDAEGTGRDRWDATQVLPSQAEGPPPPPDPSAQDTQVFDAGEPQGTRAFQDESSQETQVFDPVASQGTQPIDAGAGQDTRVFDPRAGQDTQVFDARSGQDTQVLGGGGVPQTQPLAGRPHRESVMPAAGRAAAGTPWATRGMPAERTTPPAAPPPSRPARPHSPAVPPTAATPRATEPAPAGLRYPTQRPAAQQRPAAPAAPAQRPAPAPAPAAGTDGRRGTEPTAVASLLTGLLGIVVPLVGILAIVLGGIGLDRTRRRGTNGSGMARTGMTLGTLQVLFTTLLVVGGLMFWNAYGEDIRAALDQADAIAAGEVSVPDMLLGGVTGDYSLDELQELGGMLGDADELQELGGQCRSGDAAACDDLLERVPADLLPEGVGNP